MSRVSIWWVSAAAAAVWFVSLAGVVAEEPRYSFGTAGDEGKYDYRTPKASKTDPAEKGKVDPKRQKMIKAFAARLGKLKPERSAKKSLADYFLLGTAELDPKTGHADVCFQVKQGQFEVAEHLVNYMADTPEGVLRKWHVFVRLKTSEEADQALEGLRAQYDELASYRDEIKACYGATSIRRA